MNGRARLTRCSRTAGEDSTAPPWAPSDLLRVSVADDVGTVAEPGCVQQPAATGAGDAERVRLVGDQHGASWRAQTSASSATGAASPRTE